MIVELSDGQRISCDDEPMGGGASGVTYFTTDKKWVVKLFNHPSTEIRRILEEVIGTYNCVGADPVLATNDVVAGWYSCEAPSRFENASRSKDHG